MDTTKLYEPLELKSRRGRGGEYSYVSWQDVADRMNKVFKGNWSSEVKSQEVIGGNVVVRVRVTAVDPETSMSHHQEGFGGAPNDDRAEAGNPHKSAYSKALKDACKKWGIGMYLDDEAGAPAPTTVVVPPSAPPATPPTTPPSAPATPAVPTATPPAPATPPPAVPAPNVAVAPAAPSAPPAAPTMPAVPPAAPTPPPTMPADDMPMSSGSVLSNDDNGGITEVQQIALEGILGMRDLNYEDLAKEAFEDKGMKYDTIPRAEDLTYEEAVVVVKFGNDKYRNK